MAKNRLKMSKLAKSLANWLNPIYPQNDKKVEKSKQKWSKNGQKWRKMGQKWRKMSKNRVLRING